MLNWEAHLSFLSLVILEDLHLFIIFRFMTSSGIVSRIDESIWAACFNGLCLLWVFHTCFYKKSSPYLSEYWLTFQGLPKDIRIILGFHEQENMCSRAEVFESPEKVGVIVLEKVSWQTIVDFNNYFLKGLSIHRIESMRCTRDLSWVPHELQCITVKFFDIFFAVVQIACLLHFSCQSHVFLCTVFLSVHIALLEKTIDVVSLMKLWKEMMWSRRWVCKRWWWLWSSERSCMKMMSRRLMPWRWKLNQFVADVLLQA